MRNVVYKTKLAARNPPTSVRFMNKSTFLNSNLMPFGSFRKSPIYCTPRVCQIINEITVLAELTAEVNLQCAPSIWGTEIENGMGNIRCDSDDEDYFSDLFEDFESSAGTSPSLSNLQLIAANDKFILGGGSRFFVIKSFSAENIAASFRHGIWSSTGLGNARLNKAYEEAGDGDSIILFFSVNGSSKFCGVAEMTGAVDFCTAADVWTESRRWKGVFPVRWLVAREISNCEFKSLIVPQNDNKCVTKSRDTQELPFSVGTTMLAIFSSFHD